MHGTGDRSRSPPRSSREADAKSANDGIDKDSDLLDGHSAKDIFENKSNFSGFTYDDLICMPGHIAFGVQDVALHGNFTRRIRLKTPIVSSPMDTVTEAKMAIAMALEGGIGVIHTNLSVEDQAREVLRVKKYESGFIMDPICIPPTMLISDLDDLRRKSGFEGFPITEDAGWAPSFSASSPSATRTSCGSTARP
jgi:IMP dehydrogenase